MIKMLRTVSSTLIIFSMFSYTLVHADTDSDMAEMQKKLNAENMEKPFHVEDTAKIEAYIAEAKKNKTQPRANPPNYWQPGYTCNSYYRYNYNYYDYRDCLYYYNYYGRYW